MVERRSVALMLRCADFCILHVWHLLPSLLKKEKGTIVTRRRAPPRCGQACSFEGVSEASTEGIKRTRDIHINWLGPVNVLKVSVYTVPRRGYMSRNEGNPSFRVHTVIRTAANKLSVLHCTARRRQEEHAALYAPCATQYCTGMLHARDV